VTTLASLRCMHELIEEQVDRTPDAIALVSAGEEITYRQLDARANRLARHLERLGVGPEVLVGISIERSVDMVVAAFGVLKAGGAYVPIDPAYPKKRLGFILDDAKVRVLVTQESLARDLPNHRAQLVSVDADREAIEAESEVKPPGVADRIGDDEIKAAPAGVELEIGEQCRTEGKARGPECGATSGRPAASGRSGSEK